LNLLYILSEYLPDSGGGIISHYARILPGLVARGHEVTVVLASKDKLDHPAYEIDGVRVRPLQSKYLEQYANRFGRWAGLDIFYYLLPVAWAAWAQAQEECDYDLVEVTDWALLFLPWVVAKRRAPVVVSLHGSCGQVDWFGKGEPRSLDGDLVRMVEATALRGADVVHANSRANAEFWREKTGREIRVIPPAYGGRDAADGGPEEYASPNEECFALHGAQHSTGERGLMAESGGPKVDLTTENTESTEELSTTIERQGGREKEQPKVGPKGEGVGTTESNETDGHGWEKRRATPGEPGLALSSKNSFTSELARDSKNTSPTRSASGPALAHCAGEMGSDGGNQLAESAEFLEGQSQAGLQMGNQKNRAIRAANDPSASGENSSSVPIREIRGFHSAPLDAPGLVVGRLQNWKGAEVLCRALRLVPEIGIEWVGGNTDWGSSGRKASEYLAANYPDVFGKQLRWMGRLDRVEVAKKMHAAGFLVVPSLWDVFNLTVAEGMDAGLPVICSRAAGAEMLIEHGKSGLLFDPAKPEELAECLKFVAGMSAVEKMEVGKMAQESVKNVLDGERILNLLEDSYIEAIQKRFLQRTDEWLESLLSPGAEHKTSPNMGLVRRGLGKFGRFLAKL